MKSKGINRLFSHALLWGWSIPFVLLLLPVASFTVTDRFWFAVALVTVLATLALSRVAEVASGETRHDSVKQMLPSVRQCKGAVYLFSFLTCAGSVLILLDQQSTLGDLQLQNLQRRYIELALVSNAGDRVGSGLSTIGTILRSLVYVAIVSIVAMSKQAPGLRRTALPALALLLAVISSEIATASRMYVIFCVVLGVVAGIVVRHPKIRRLGTLFALTVAGAILFSITTAQRIEESLGDQSLALDYLTGFFDVDLLWLGQWIADDLGAPAVTALLYLSHSLPEFSRLVADGSTQFAMGAHSLYLIVGPLMRLLGYDVITAATASVERPGMWWGMLGDLYLDFGIAFVIVYPLLVVLMVQIARRLEARNVYALTLKCMTAAILFASPFFGVLNTYSFSYILLLTLAWLHVSLRKRKVAAPPTAKLAQST